MSVCDVGRTNREAAGKSSVREERGGRRCRSLLISMKSLRTLEVTWRNPRFVENVYTSCDGHLLGQETMNTYIEQ